MTDQQTVPAQPQPETVADAEIVTVDGHATTAPIRTKRPKTTTQPQDGHATGANAAPLGDGHATGATAVALRDGHATSEPRD
ncbi:hypothetical protein ACMA1D_06380 [Streptomyces sp. 796.1]|uniref:hypothetical protein n=1 Tax=Streptomyces sp. 796.1 TaxID=3163029 RepID=UPI0039C9B8DA